MEKHTDEEIARLKEERKKKIELLTAQLWRLSKWTIKAQEAGTFTIAKAFRVARLFNVISTARFVVWSQPIPKFPPGGLHHGGPIAIVGADHLGPELARIIRSSYEQEIILVGPEDPRIRAHAAAAFNIHAAETINLAMIADGAGNILPPDIPFITDHSYPGSLLEPGSSKPKGKKKKHKRRNK